MQNLVSESLQIVGEELAVTFSDVRLSLEQYAEGEKGPQSLERCLILLHTAIGVLKITETHGAGLLTEEMESTCRYLSKLRHKDSGSEEAMEALSRAAIQLPAYVERIINGGQDIPLVLLPLLNDLRAARGKPLLSESTLLLLNISSPAQQKAHVQSRKISGEDIAKLCRELRPVFQLALLGWIKSAESGRSLEQIAKIAERLEHAATTLEVHQLWWVIGGIVEALITGGLETSVSLKRLMGQVDREMKRLLTVGETKFAEQPPTELINNLLYYIARAASDGPRVTAIRAAFNLSNLIPADDQVEMVRESLAAPSAKLMHTVAQAIRDDLARVKDVLDIYVRTGMEHAEELGPQIELLKKIGDTMGVLGLGELREEIESKRQNLAEVIDNGEQVEEGMLMEMAAALLRVEDHLDEQLFSMIRPPEAQLETSDEDAEPVDTDYEIVASAVMREAIVNLARVKDAVTQGLEKPADTTLLDSVPQNLRGITAGLLIVERDAAVSVVNEIGESIGVLMQEGYANVDKRELDLLADAIVSLEYYLETLQAGRKEPRYMLDNARTCLKTLREGGKDTIPKFADIEISSAATTMQAPGTESTMVSLMRPTDTQIETVALIPEGEGTERVAPELIELFIEEAGEAIESINKLFPVWAEDESEHGALAEIRRAMHTLKGSGRVVGAALMGEFCWSIENLLNRILNNTIERAPEIIEFLGRAIGALPELLEQLEVGTAPKCDVQSLIAESEAYATGQARVTRAIAPEDHLEVLQEPVQSDAAAPRFDAELLEILSKETATHLDVISRYVEECRTGTPPFDISDEVHRACHTLHGSVTMAKAEPAAEITQPLNELVRRAFDHQLAVDEPVITACADAVRALAVIVECLSDVSREMPDFGELRARLVALDEELEGRSAQATAATPGQAREPEFDIEVAGIFAEEAAEILERIDAVLAGSTGGLMSDEALAELQRCLHTLKGGARMAGLLPMGDLSHDLETYLLRLSSGGLRQNPDRLELLQETVDELHRLSETVSQGDAKSPPQKLVDRLQAALNAEDREQTEEQPEKQSPEAPEESEAAREKPSETGEAAATEPVAKDPRPIPVDEQLGQLARELQEPAKPEPGGLTALVKGSPPEVIAPERRDFARVDPAVLEQLLNNAGEVSIFQSRLSQQMSQIQFNLDELGQTVLRLRQQLRGLEVATEAQILYQHDSDVSATESADPLKLERYSKIQQLTRALTETASDVSSIKDLLQSITGDTEALLVQQARTAGELQDGLMRTRMVPFQQHAARLARLVRQMATEHDKQAELSLQGGGEIDRQVLEKMLPPFEHMLRNAVIHGIETPKERKKAGKPEVGKLSINVHRDGSQVVIDISDDGKGMDIDSIRRKAVELGLCGKDDEVSDEEVLQFVLRSGFSTADRLTQASGRGIGMDVVANEVARLGGTLRVDTRRGEGTTITVRLPFTLAVTQALIVRAADELYALPLPTVEGIIRISRSEFLEKIAEDAPSIDYGDQTYRLRYLGQYLGLGSARIPEDEERVSIILIRAGNNSTALVTDEMLDSREIIVKSIGTQLAAIRGVSGATILGDGRIAIILDAGALVRLAPPLVEPVETGLGTEAEKLLALVVDDSITMRRVSQRLLERNGFRVLTARDGLQAVGVLRDHRPDIILLDVEMPRMDGYEFAVFVRNNPGTEDVPIIMITSRVSDKHKARAIELGVNDYLSKPYQEGDLLNAMRHLLQTD